MSTEARIHINSHRLMRDTEAPVYEQRVLGARDSLSALTDKRHARVKRRTFVHALTFIASFIFTTGVAVLCILLWVRPDSLVSLIVTGILSACVFVATFAGLRMHILHSVLDEYPNKEEDPGREHHWGKSIAYGLVALVLALVLAGLLINAASAFAAMHVS